MALRDGARRNFQPAPTRPSSGWVGVLDHQNGVETLGRALVGFEPERSDRQSRRPCRPRHANARFRIVARRTHNAPDEILNAPIVAVTFRNEVVIHQPGPAAQHATASPTDMQNLSGRIDQHRADAEHFESIRNAARACSRNDRLEHAGEIFGVLYAEILRIGALPSVWRKRKRHVAPAYGVPGKSSYSGQVRGVPGRTTQPRKKVRRFLPSRPAGQEKGRRSALFLSPTMVPLTQPRPVTEAAAGSPATWTLSGPGSGRRANSRPAAAWTWPHRFRLGSAGRR